MSLCIFGYPINACLSDQEKLKLIEFLARGYLDSPPVQPYHIPWYIDDEELEWKYDLQYRLHHLVRFASAKPDQYFEQCP